MAHSNEITIRVASPLLFIDDEEPSLEMSGHESMRNLTVVNRRTVDTSSDTSPMPSLGPKAPIALQEQLSENSRHKSRKQQFELTIRGENTIINIQTASPRQTKCDDDELYNFINKRVQEVFQTPERDEIEKALENVGYQDSKKQRIFTKKAAWKLLSAKSSKISKEREERYPSIVLLQDPPKPKIIEETYPKMFYVKEDNQKIEKPKFDYRSKSMLSLREKAPNLFSPSMSELCFEKQNIALERCYLEKEKDSLAEERADLEKGKNKLEKQKQSVERSKSFLIQDQNILKEKRQILRHEKASISEKDNDANMIKKEKLCLKFEKQLIEDEKKIMNDEQSIIYEEKEIINKEKDILGNEKNVLDEERIILSKEKSNLEKQQSIVSESFKEIDNRPNVTDDVMNEIENVFHESCNLSRSHDKTDFRPPLSPSIHFQNSFSPCNLNTAYPVYIPVYNLPRPYASPYRPCCSSIDRCRSIQTQTENLPMLSDATDNLPMNLLSGIFPRVLITSMNTLAHGAEIRAEDVKKNRVREIINEEPSPGPSKARQDKRFKKLINVPRKSVVVPKKLELPAPDLTLKAKSIAAYSKYSESFEDPESGIQTFTSEVAIKDDFSPVSDETMSVETIHFGYSDDFYSNEALFPVKSSSTETKTITLPLTNAGHEIYEKLTKLSVEQDNSKIEDTKGNENMNNLSTCNFNLNLHISDGSIKLNLPSNISMQINSNSCDKCCPNINCLHSGATKLQIEDENEKRFIKRSDLWYSPDSISEPNKFNQRKMKNNEISVQISNGPNVQLQEGMSNMNVTVCGSRNNTCDAYVGPDTKFEGQNHSQQKQLSPRTADLLEALKRKLEFSESERKIISYGKTDSRENKHWDNAMDKHFSGLYLVQQLQNNKTFEQKTSCVKPPGNKVEPREYLCEECLATMRLYEDDFQSVQNIINKFENINRFGFK